MIRVSARPRFLISKQEKCADRSPRFEFFHIRPKAKCFMHLLTECRELPYTVAPFASSRCQENSHFFEKTHSCLLDWSEELRAAYDGNAITAHEFEPQLANGLIPARTPLSTGTPQLFPKRMTTTARRQNGMEGGGRASPRQIMVLCLSTLPS
jgi:hypothetical protein